MVRPEEGPYRLDADVGREDEEADCHKLLRPPLGGLGVTPSHAEAPHDDEPGERLDQAVEAEADQRDGRRRDARGDSDGELHEVPRVAAPSEQPRATHKASSLIRI